MGLSIVLIEPKIPQNTGNIARLAAATGTTLHLIQPLGFHLTDDGLKRAGLDYWEHVDLWIHPNWREFRESISRRRCLYFSSHGTRPYTDAVFEPNSVLVFGNETAGLPIRIREKHPERTFRIPMAREIRSLNLATAVGIVTYEGLRQLHIDLDAADEPADLSEQDST